MLYRIRVSYADADEEEREEEAWWEEYDKDIEDPQQWAEETIESFNDTLRPSERPRVLLDVEVLDADTKKQHSWVKTTLAMKRDHNRGSYYDEYKCTTCGVTGKRYTIGGPIRLDHKYRRSKVYHRCDTAQEHIEEHGHPQG